MLCQVHNSLFFFHQLTNLRPILKIHGSFWAFAVLLSGRLIRVSPARMGRFYFQEKNARS